MKADLTEYTTPTGHQGGTQESNRKNNMHEGFCWVFFLLENNIVMQTLLIEVLQTYIWRNYQTVMLAKNDFFFRPTSIS